MLPDMLRLPFGANVSRTRRRESTPLAASRSSGARLLRRGLLLGAWAIGVSVAQEPAPKPEEPAPKVAEPARRRTVAQLPGVQATGEVLLPNQWSLRPAGTQVPVGDFPVQLAVHPSEQWIAVLHAGAGVHEIITLATDGMKILGRYPLEQTFQGLTFSPDGNTLFASGGEYEVVHRFKFAGGLLTDPKVIRIVPEADKFVVGGLAISRDGNTLAACGTWGHRVALTPADGTGPARLIDIPGKSHPVACLWSPDGSKLYVSCWGLAKVAVLNVAEGTVAGYWATESNPSELILSKDEKRLLVACSNSTKVRVLGVADGKPIETIHAALYPSVPKGNTPNSLALTDDGKVLFVANADGNNVAMFNVEEPGKAKPMGFIPVGWYPTNVRWLKEGKRIIVANGKGGSSRPNPMGPNPERRAPRNLEQYIGRILQGTLSVLPMPTAEQGVRMTREAYRLSPLKGDLGAVGRREKDSPIPAKVGDKGPIEHCLYIIKENRTYDQVFGALPQGNGDPNLCLFGEEVTPNHHALAREFVLLDNFYVDGEVSADGHEWTMGAYATEYVEKSWPLTYRGGDKDKIGYPSEGSGGTVAAADGGYFWDRCAEAGVSYFSFGEWIENGRTPNDPSKARVKALEGHFDPGFRGYDLEYPDVKRAERFISEYQRMERENRVPKFIVLRLPNDHTSGTRVGKPTPRAMVADNDLALGMVVEAVSKSSLWGKTAIFVVEDDAQNGPDHVDAHRAVALVISPWTKRGHVDSTMYSTCSMLRTMGLILGTKPLSQYDAAARPMFNSFAATPTLTPYAARPARIDLNEKNRRTAWGAELSETLNLAREDQADDILFNEIIWRSVKGPDSPMPPPVRAAFYRPVKATKKLDDDDD